MIPAAPETTPEFWQQLEALYPAALATRGEAREALLARIDPVLKAKVEVLPANTETEEGKFDGPAWEWDKNDYDVTPAVEAEMLTGQLIGPYCIEAKVGAESIGVVHRATDTRLHRLVALKICQWEFTALFEREARVIATLNHPNISQI